MLTPCLHYTYDEPSLSPRDQRAKCPGCNCVLPHIYMQARCATTSYDGHDFCGREMHRSHGASERESKKQDAVTSSPYLHLRPVALAHDRGEINMRILHRSFRAHRGDKLVSLSTYSIGVRFRGRIHVIIIPCLIRKGFGDN